MNRVVQVKITPHHVTQAIHELGFKHHRELVAHMFEKEGYIVVDFVNLNYFAYKAEKGVMRIEGHVGKTLVKK